MLVPISSTVTLQTHYIQQRGSVFQFVMRVPSDLIPRIGKKFVRMSLKTRDPKEAIKRAEPLAEKYLSQFEALQADKTLLPEHAARTAKQIAQGYGAIEHFLNLVVEPKLIKHAGGDETRYTEVEPTDFLTPLEQKVLTFSTKVRVRYGFQEPSNCVERLTRRQVTRTSSSVWNATGTS
jgi:hypothetical protein